MNDVIAALLTELRTLVGDLGKNGGQLSPSVYDTAQVLRLYPPAETTPAIAWLLAQQQPDGGWESPATPYARDVSTLAALLALHPYRQSHKLCDVIDTGFAFLQRQAGQWAELPLDALPIAAEVILPYLVEEAHTLGLTLEREPYALLYRLRQHKIQQILRQALRVGTPPTHSWEALGKEAPSLLPDYSGGIGHSPAATAAWLRQAEQHPNLAAGCTTARQYLLNAARATDLDTPGVVPNVWPIIGFELAYAPYTLLLTGLLHYPALQDVVEPLLDELWIIMQRGHGVSFGEYFMADVDDTGLAVAVLQAAGRPVNSAVILQFRDGKHFCTFPNELNPSVFANAHALYGLAAAGDRDPGAEQFLLDRQCADGHWLADKLHSSWLYTTLEVVLALDCLDYREEIRQAGAAVIQRQQEAGSWGSGQHATRIETSYALLILSTLRQRRLLDEAGETALQRGYEWLSQAYHPQRVPDERLWLGKVPYAPYRVDRIYELGALLSVTLERIPG
jgi:hypothetical protein